MRVLFEVHGLRPDGVKAAIAKKIGPLTERPGTWSFEWLDQPGIYSHAYLWGVGLEDDCRSSKDAETIMKRNGLRIKKNYMDLPVIA